jgi:hypothetical protein
MGIPVLANRVELNDVWIVRSLHSLHHLIHVLFHKLRVADTSIHSFIDFSVGMDELAAHTVGTIHIHVKLFA